MTADVMPVLYCMTEGVLVTQTTGVIVISTPRPTSFTIKANTVNIRNQRHPLPLQSTLVTKSQHHRRNNHAYHEQRGHDSRSVRNDGVADRLVLPRWFAHHPPAHGPFLRRCDRVLGMDHEACTTQPSMRTPSAPCASWDVGISQQCRPPHGAYPEQPVVPSRSPRLTP